MRRASPGLLAAALACAAAGVAAAPEDDALRLETPDRSIRIEVRCEEGVVSCDDVRYRALNKRSGRTLRLRGRTHHSLCADGVTPCRFLGYVFHHGARSYFVSEAGRLTVSKAGAVLFEEAGAWQ